MSGSTNSVAAAELSLRQLQGLKGILTVGASLLANDFREQARSHREG